MRCVTRNDVDELAELDILVFPATCYNERTLAIEIELGFGWVELNDAGEIVAYALLRDDGLILDLIHLGVHPSWRRRGLGAKLLAATLGLKRHTILTVDPTNHDALRLYRRYGFEIVGRLNNSSQSWVMQRTPTSAAY